MLVLNANSAPVKAKYVGKLFTIHAISGPATMPTRIAKPNSEIERYFVCKNQLQYLEKPLKF